MFGQPCRRCLLVQRSPSVLFPSAGQSSSAAKIKSLTAALDTMMETRHAFQLIHAEMLEEQRQVRSRVLVGGLTTQFAKWRRVQ